MDLKATKKELDVAYKSIDTYERQIRNLLTERKQLQMTLDILEKGGFIKMGKLDEAREFCGTFNLYDD